MLVCFGVLFLFCGTHAQIPRCKNLVVQKKTQYFSYFIQLPRRMAHSVPGRFFLFWRCDILPWETLLKNDTFGPAKRHFLSSKNGRFSRPRQKRGGVIGEETSRPIMANVVTLRQQSFLEEKCPYGRQLFLKVVLQQKLLFLLYSAIKLEGDISKHQSRHMRRM